MAASRGRRRIVPLDLATARAQLFVESVEPPSPAAGTTANDRGLDEHPLPSPRRAEASCQHRVVLVVRGRSGRPEGRPLRFPIDVRASSARCRRRRPRLQMQSRSPEADPDPAAGRGRGTRQIAKRTGLPRRRRAARGTPGPPDAGGASRDRTSRGRRRARTRARAVRGSAPASGRRRPSRRTARPCALRAARGGRSRRTRVPRPAPRRTRASHPARVVPEPRPRRDMRAGDRGRTGERRPRSRPHHRTARAPAARTGRAQEQSPGPRSPLRPAR